MQEAAALPPSYDAHESNPHTTTNSERLIVMHTWVDIFNDKVAICSWFDDNGTFLVLRHKVSSNNM